MTGNQQKTTPSLLRRYPGPRPFNYNDREIFRGRKKEVGELSEQIRLYNHILLYARSGIGKSSLIDAGLLPELERTGNYLPFKIIFGAYNKKKPIPPLDSTILSLQKKGTELAYLDKLIFEENSFWYQLKQLQASLVQPMAARSQNRPLFEALQSLLPAERMAAGSPQRPLSKVEAPVQAKEILLIFDQFEELFTYPPEDINEFKQALAEVMFIQIPERFRLQLKALGDTSGWTDHDMELIHLPLNLKILFSIRSDRMALLNRLTDCIPDILKNFYEIRPLTRVQTGEAITGPASMEGDFAVAPFSYDPVLLSEILDYLAKDQEQYIESFQVQIICKYIEDLLLASPGKTIISKTDVQSLENIFFSFYEKAISKVPDSSWYSDRGIPLPSRDAMNKIQQATRVLVEKEMIFRTGNETGIRLNLYREQIEKEFSEVDDAALWTLVNERILRDSPDAAGRMRYELSHDTLVKPILNALDIREKDLREKADREQRNRLEREEFRSKSREIGITGKVELDMGYIADSILRDRAVLILGENALCNTDGIPLFKKFVESLRYRFMEKGFSYDEEEQLFWLDNPVEQMDVLHDMIGFYNSIDHNIPLLQAILKIPFTTILNFDSSDLLTRALSARKIPYESGTYLYDKRDTPMAGTLFSHEKLTVYNLLGSISEINSLLISREDTYKHLYGILGNNPLPAGLRQRLNNATTIIMVGVNFLRNSNQAVLWQILHDNRKSLRITVGHTGELGKVELQVKALLNTTFPDQASETFFNDLSNLIKEKNFNKAGAGETVALNKIEITDMLVNGQLDSAIQQLLNFVRINNAEAEIASLSSLQIRLNQVQKEFTNGLMSTEEAMSNRKRITSQVLNLLDRLSSTK